MGLTTAIIASSVIGAGGAMYTADKQASAQKDAQRRQEEAKRKADAEARRIAMETKPTGESATLDVGGSKNIGKRTQSTADFLVPTNKSLNSSGKSGLGFSV